MSNDLLKKWEERIVLDNPPMLVTFKHSGREVAVSFSTIDISSLVQSDEFTKYTELVKTKRIFGKDLSRLTEDDEFTNDDLEFIISELQDLFEYIYHINDSEVVDIILYRLEDLD